MKKVLIVTGIVLVIVGIIVGFFITINKEKEHISADEFNTIMENKDYTTIETTSLFVQYENYMYKSYLAKEDGYQIEFYELSNEENAIDMYNTNEFKFKKEKENISAYTTVSMRNYSKFELTTNGKYKYLSRIDNTLIYIDVDEEYKDTVKSIMKEIGY